MCEWAALGRPSMGATRHAPRWPHRPRRHLRALHHEAARLEVGADRPRTLVAPGCSKRDSQDLWIGVSRDLQLTNLRFLAPFDELALLDYRAQHDARPAGGQL